MENGTRRPYKYGDEIALLGAHPVDKLTGKEIGHGIENGKQAGDRTIIVVVPMKLGRDEIFPCERKHLPIHVVDSGCQKQQRTNDPTEVGHLRSLYIAHLFQFISVQES